MTRTARITSNSQTVSTARAIAVVVRVPRSNGATYLAFRKSGLMHVDFDGLYDRQQARSGGEAA